MGTDGYESGTPASEDEQQRSDALLVTLMFSTSLIDVIVELSRQRGLLTFTASSNKIEMGYVAHLSKLGELLLQVSDKNDIIKEQLNDNSDWVDYEKLYLRPRMEKRNGALCRGKQYEK